MQHSAHTTSPALSVGVQVIVCGVLRAGDTLALEYPNDARANVSVAEVIGDNAIIVEGSDRWRMTPATSKDRLSGLSVPAELNPKNWLIRSAA